MKDLNIQEVYKRQLDLIHIMKMKLQFGFFLYYLDGYDDHEVIYIKTFKYIDPCLESFSMLIFTDKCIMIVYQTKELILRLI